MDDLISKQDAIACAISGRVRALPTGAKCEDWIRTEEVRQSILNLPSAQPEIIRCKDCKHGIQDEHDRWSCRGLGCQIGDADGNGFCSDAERKDDD